MKFKPLLYFTITSLILAILGTGLQLFTNLEWSDYMLDYSMRMAEIGGLLLIVVNGSLLFQTRKMATIGIAALITTAGFILPKFIFVMPALWIAFILKIVGLGTIMWTYLKWFKGKCQKHTLDYLKLFWIISKITTSLLVVLAATIISKYLNQLTNVLFYTMLIYFIWFAFQIKGKESEAMEEVAQE